MRAATWIAIELQADNNPALNVPSSSCGLVIATTRSVRGWSASGYSPPFSISPGAAFGRPHPRLLPEKAAAAVGVDGSRDLGPRSCRIGRSRALPSPMTSNFRAGLCRPFRACPSQRVVSGCADATRSPFDMACAVRPPVCHQAQRSAACTAAATAPRWRVARSSPSGRTAIAVRATLRRRMSTRYAAKRRSSMR